MTSKILDTRTTDNVPEDAAQITTRTAGQAVIDGLRAHGVDTFFGIPGVQSYELFDALHQEDAIEVIGARHEQACAYMALGYAQSTGKTGVYSVVPGPGILNAGAGILTSLSTSTPTVCLTSEIPTDYMGRGMGHLHEMPDQLGTVKSFAKWAENVLDPALVPATVDEAFRQAGSGRPGPAVVAVPWDVLTQRAQMPANQPAFAPTPALDPEVIQEAARILSGAKNPMIMVGSGARHAAPEVLALAEKLQAPVVSFRGGRGIVPDSHPLGFTCAAGFERWNNTDVLLGIGSRQELMWFRWPDKPENLVHINLDIDPAQHDRLETDLGITADSRDGTVALLDALAESPTRASRHTEFGAVKTAKKNEIAGLTPHADYLGSIREALPYDGFFVEEVSQIGFSSFFGIDMFEPRRFITCGYQGNLGYGFPTALGVQAGNRDKVVISVTGDGGFLYGAQELATAVQHGLNVITVVFNNAAFGNVKADQLRIYGQESASELHNPDFVAFAESFGALGLHAHTPAELKSAIQEAIEAKRPTVIEVPMPLSLKDTPWKFLMPASRKQ
ncbi:thiamine pyrophosphate-dependent enzyme [Paenarthrobacter nitroguajacolicus]|uniref:thiamine pyrophosphate-dependent enzyme n=1 Tax=Paenarthrobacter nitroguajacolicus TaxID=211146 RepID=UPI00286290DE|nr:thiamine pyrophosphate-dependent enzyme [Paenarthrobacter nitroguajacolicus]MDR6639624.1 acetolactate synthase-1/2/3 large subunit [Paenarthrobacter nitroguajacolicus]